MLDQNFLDDQTIFAEEEPFHLSERKKKPLTATSVQKPPTLVFVLIVVFVSLLLFALVAKVLKNKQQTVTTNTTTQTPTPVPQSASQIDQMMLELRSAVSNADPAKTALPFPPIADQIKISQ